MNLAIGSISYSMPVQPSPLDKGFFYLLKPRNFSLTQLPKNTAIIRAVGIGIFTAVTCLVSSGWFWPVMILGNAFAGWTIYSNILTSDPLVESLYKIVGDRGKFEQLEEITFSKDGNSLKDNILSIDWDNLKKSIYRAKTADGRTIMIVKAQSKQKHPEVNCNTKSIFAFVEKLRPSDFNPLLGLYTPLDALGIGPGSFGLGNTAGNFIKDTCLYHKVTKEGSHSTVFLFSCISPELAKEIKEQI